MAERNFLKVGIMCVLVIIYYKMDFVEKTSMYDSYMLIGDKYYEPFDTEQQVQKKIEEFRAARKPWELIYLSF